MGHMFEGREVTAQGITVPKLSGGLNKAVAVNDLFLQVGDHVALVLWCETTAIHHDLRNKDSDDLQRNQVLALLNAAPIDVERVADLLVEQEARQAKPTLSFVNGDGPEAVGE